MAAVMETQGMRLSELLGARAGLHADIVITDLASDDRDVVPGAAFVALGGARNHGLEFADAARARGAAVVLYDRATTEKVPSGPSIDVRGLRDRLGELARTFYGPRVSRATVVGITGTNGKTTVAYLLAQALSKLGRTCGYIGTLGFGVPPQLAAHRLTTPDCLTLHREIALLPVVAVALEVSSHALVQDRAAGLDLRHAVFTNLSHDHLDAHGSIEAYGHAKTLLFTRPEAEHAVLNLDDPFAQRLREAIAASVRVLGVTTDDDAGADLAGTAQHRGLAGQDIEIRGAYGRGRIRSGLVGAFNTSNLVVTLGALLNLDVSFSEACEALGACAPPPGRMEVFGGGDAPWVVVDYAHTPDALQRVIAALRSVADGALWCVFGCGGERDAAKRPAMGHVSAAAEHVVLTDDNPRGEDPDAIIAAIHDASSGHASVRIERDRRKAIALAVAGARRGDVVLVAGRGAEPRQLFADHSTDFDDRAVVRSILGHAA
jgi:UDP-N-acetylmuramoyl-L-alanyl-D-glutamate--2,6-diaminopimelate ligase